jgi:hypothetical protein
MTNKLYITNFKVSQMIKKIPSTSKASPDSSNLNAFIFLEPGTDYAD